jgi:hypothetical protein
LVLRCDGEADAHVPRRPTTPLGRDAARSVLSHCERFRRSFRSPVTGGAASLQPFLNSPQPSPPFRHCCRRWSVARGTLQRIDTRHLSSLHGRPEVRGDAPRIQHPVPMQSRTFVHTLFREELRATAGPKCLPSSLEPGCGSNGVVGVSSERDHPAKPECLLNLGESPARRGRSHPRLGKGGHPPFLPAAPLPKSDDSLPR